MDREPERKDVPRAVVVTGRTPWDLIAESPVTPRVEKLLLGALDGVDLAVGLSKRGVARVAKVLGRVGEKLDAVGGADLRAIPERVGAEVLIHVAREDREELHELWVNLLVGAATGMDVDAFYIDIVRKLDSDTVTMLPVLVDAARRAASEHPDPSVGTAGYGDGRGDGSGAGYGDGSGDGSQVGPRWMSDRARFIEDQLEGVLPTAKRYQASLGRLTALGLAVRGSNGILAPTVAATHLLALVVSE